MKYDAVYHQAFKPSSPRRELKTRRGPRENINLGPVDRTPLSAIHVKKYGSEIVELPSAQPKHSCERECWTQIRLKKKKKRGRSGCSFAFYEDFVPLTEGG
jgi:hypothetical protein